MQTKEKKKKTPSKNRIRTAALNSTNIKFARNAQTIKEQDVTASKTNIWLNIFESVENEKHKNFITALVTFTTSAK